MGSGLTYFSASELGKTWRNNKMRGREVFILHKVNLDAPQERERMEIMRETICVELIWPVLRIITN